jgi:UDP-N-acetylglucosamine pyrophosphorylase
MKRISMRLTIALQLMNSFSTSEDTLAFFNEKYPALAGEDGLEMMQNKVPKIRADNLEVNTSVAHHASIGSEQSRISLVIFPAGNLRNGPVQRMVPTGSR